MKKIIIGLFILVSCSAIGQINVGTNFQITGQIPIDERTVFDSIELRDALLATYRYDGLIAYVKDIQKTYQLKGCIENSCWVEIASTPIVGDTSFFDPTCTGITIIDSATGVTWEHVKKYDGTGNQIGCEWVNVSTRPTIPNPNILLNGVYSDTLQFTNMSNLGSARPITLDSVQYGSRYKVVIGVDTVTNIATKYYVDSIFLRKLDTINNPWIYSGGKTIQRSIGNVGIGTTSPLYQLHVEDSENTYISFLKNTHATDGNGLQILAGDSDTEKILSLGDKDGTTRYTFGSGGTTYIQTIPYASGSSLKMVVHDTTSGTLKRYKMPNPVIRLGPFICGGTFTISHKAGSVSPVDKTTTYLTVKDIPGETDKCWITSNLGSDHEATSATDNTEASAGWYWQFNQKQGYKHDGAARTPNSTWITTISEYSNWLPANDPCSIELGTAWRIPTLTEWTNVDASGSWGNYTDAYNSDLKLHTEGYINSSGVFNYRGSQGAHWSSTEWSATYGEYLVITSSGSITNHSTKALGLAIRCISSDVLIDTVQFLNINQIKGIEPVHLDTISNDTLAISVDTTILATQYDLTQISTPPADTNLWNRNVNNIYNKNNGNVGIGTTSPLMPLHIGAGTRSPSSDAQLLISRSVDNGTSGNGHCFSDGSTITRTGTIAYNSYDARISIAGTANYDHYAAFQAAPTIEGSGALAKYYGLFSSITANSGTVTDLYNLYAAEAQGSGGTITNNYGLYVAPLTKGATSNWAVYTNGSTKSYFGGNVGLGTTNPATALDLGASGVITTADGTSANWNTAYGWGDWHGHSQAISTITGLQDSLTDSWNKRDTNVLASKEYSGHTFEPKLAIGTTAQYYRGDKSWQTLPTISASDTNLWLLTGSDIKNKNSGKVGVGLTPVAGDSALQALSIHSTRDINVNGVKVGRGKGNILGNTITGDDAGKSNTSGGDNTANGYQSLNKNTTGNGQTGIGAYSLLNNTTGTNNTAIGAYTLRSNNTGLLNSAFGINALYTNTTGSYNVMSGAYSGYLNLSGKYNTSNGYKSLYSNTTGYSNTAVGMSALYSNTTASNLVAVGDSALYFNTGTLNTAVGSKALWQNTTGTSNTANGYKSLYSNVTSNYNTATGTSALYNSTAASNTAHGALSMYSTTSGTGNTANGSYSLFGNTTGDYNVASGFRAARYISDGATANQTGSNSVFLGADTKPLGIGETNQIAIGYGTIGHGSNTTTIGNTSTTDTYLAGTVVVDSIPNDTGADSVVTTKNGRLYRAPIPTPAANTVTGTQTTNYVPYATGASTIASSGLWWDNGNGRLGIGTTNPSTYTVSIVGSLYASSFIRTGSYVQWSNGLLSGGGNSYFTAGNVGIGTTAPSSKLEVKASGKVIGSAMNLTDSVGTSLMYVKSDGKVGIGTTAPGYPLSVTGIINSSSSVYASNGNAVLNAQGLEVIYPGVVNIRNSSTNAASALAFYTKNTEVARFNPSGLLGIGTTNPSEKLHVVGEIKCTDTLRVGDYTTYSYAIPGGSWVTSSTKEVKKNIFNVPTPDSLFTKVLGINPKTWNFKEEAFRKKILLEEIEDSVMVDSVWKKRTLKEKKIELKRLIDADSLQADKLSKRKFTGFIAEDINTLTGKKSKEVDQAEIIAILWKTNQELIKKTNELELRLQTIEKQLKQTK